MTKKSVIRPPSPFILSPGERKWLSAGSGFADHRSANPVVRFFKWTANDSPFLSPAHRMGEGGRRSGEGMSLAGVRTVVSTNFVF